jgi:succinate dehydrogenase/fumarate reductase iron-sulfur protein
MVLTVFRLTPGSPARMQAYHVEPATNATVLDALVTIRQTQDATLAFRYACRVGMCGSCAMVVNGRETWACRLRLQRLHTDRVTVRPLYHFPVIRDLVVDMAPFARAMARTGAAFVPSAPDDGPARIASRAPERRAIDPAIQCIGCGACVSACGMVGWDAAFPGPAALNRAFTLAADSRDAGSGTRWAAVFGEDGVWRCHTQGQCTAVCPMELSPADSILALRRLQARSLLTRR